MKAHGTIDRRRSRRVFLAIPVRLRAVKQDGTLVEESAETVVISPYFHFELYPTNLPMLAVINIYAGLNAMKTLWRSIPNG